MQVPYFKPQQIRTCWAEIETLEACRQYCLRAGSPKAAEVYKRAVARIRTHMRRYGVVA